MRSPTVRRPDQLVREIEAKARERNCAKSDAIADLIGSVDGLPPDLSIR